MPTAPPNPFSELYHPYELPTSINSKVKNGNVTQPFKGSFKRSVSRNNNGLPKGPTGGKRRKRTRKRTRKSRR